MPICSVLPPCPICSRSTYKYGFSLATSLAQGFDLKKIAAGLASRNIATVAQGGGGFVLGLFKLMKNAVDDVPDHPLLRCAHCQSLTILCPKCETMLYLKEQPETGAILRCGACQGGFTHCERHPHFKNLVQH